MSAPFPMGYASQSLASRVDNEREFGAPPAPESTGVVRGTPAEIQRE